MKTYCLIILVFLCRGLQGHPLTANNETRYEKERSVSCNQDEVLCSALGSGDTFRCVKKTSLCDGINDCPAQDSFMPYPFSTGVDENERFCTSKCPERNEIQCPRDGKCILKDKVCDGKYDCPDKWDEHDCCGPTGFSCENGNENENNICISNRMRCDGIKDCKNGLDESPKADCDCDQHTEFTCTDLKKCVKLSEKCNKISDCPDSSDEEECRFCDEETEFTCKTGLPICIPKMIVCDRTRDCLDASDEDNCPSGSSRQVWRDNVINFHKLVGVPPNFAKLSCGNFELENNDEINTEECLERPIVEWTGNEDTLYTVIMVDMSIQIRESFPDGPLDDKTFLHWVRINIKGTNSESSGEEFMEYSPGFAFRTCFDGVSFYGNPCYWDNSKLDYGYYINDENYKHTFVTMIFSQSGLIDVKVGEGQHGCNQDLLGKRYKTFDGVIDLIKKYDLTLEAGHWYKSPWTAIVDKLLCLYTRCAGGTAATLFPPYIVKDGNLDGNNFELPECAPFTGDITLPINYLALRN